MASAPVGPRPAVAPGPVALWRLRGRVRFARLGHEGCRVRRGPLWVTACAAAPGAPAEVGFAVGRRVGPAVARNRIRRRLRAACRTLADQGRLPGGMYLLGGDAELAGLAWPDLVELVAAGTGSAHRRSQDRQR